MPEYTAGRSVAIIDTTDPIRRGKLREAFEAAKYGVVCFEHGTGGYHAKPAGTVLGTRFDVVLWHVGDYRLYPKGPKISGHPVYYGGDGGRDARIPEGAERIWRPLLGLQTRVTAKEASEIFEYMAAISRGLDAEKPSVLQPDRSHSYLTALSVLCQGYLITWAEAHRDSQVPSAIHDALEGIGWYKLSEEARRSLDPELGRRYSKEPEGVQAICWWDVFGLREADAGEIPELKLEEFKSQLAAELSAPISSNLLSLIQVFKKGVVDEPEKVARAWMDIRDHLASAG